MCPGSERLERAGLRDASDLRSLDDLRKLPFTVKTDLRDNYPYGLFARPVSELARLYASSGTTGKPTAVGYTLQDLSNWADLMARSLFAGGVRPGAIEHNAYGYGLFTGGLGAHDGATRLGATVVPVSGGGIERQVTLLMDFGARVLCSTPSFALAIAEQALCGGKQRFEWAPPAPPLWRTPDQHLVRIAAPRLLQIRAPAEWMGRAEQPISQGFPDILVQRRSTGCQHPSDGIEVIVVNRECVGRYARRNSGHLLNAEGSYTAASLVELLHTATLVHDDVVDEANERRGFFSINALWTNKIAVLVGDYLLSQGLLLSVKTQQFELLEIVSRAVKEMAEGELLQIEKARRLDIDDMGCR